MPAEQGKNLAARSAKLRQIQILHRHGARTPLRESEFSKQFNCGVEAYKTFIRFMPITSTGLRPDNNANAPSCYLGQLTPLGAAQMYALGARLRDRYQEHIPFQLSSLSVRSTYVTRAVESAQALVSGMFPSESGKIHIDVKQPQKDSLLGNSCPALIDVFRRIRSTWSRSPENIQKEALSVAPSLNIQESHYAVILRDIALAVAADGGPCNLASRTAINLATDQIASLYSDKQHLRLSHGRVSNLEYHTFTAISNPKQMCDLCPA